MFSQGMPDGINVPKLFGYSESHAEFLMNLKGF